MKKKYLLTMVTAILGVLLLDLVGASSWCAARLANPTPTSAAA
jgi:hypothetical protein